MFGGGIVLKSPREIEAMAESGRILASVHERLRDIIRPGLETMEIDRTAESMIREAGGTCTFKGYKGYPFNTCVSVNEEVVHGFPSERKLKSGDIVSVDIGVTYRNFVADSAVTFPVGKISPELSRLLSATRESLYAAVESSVEGNYIQDVSRAVETRAHEDGFSVVEKYVGHGIGRRMHEKPEVPNFVRGSRGPRISNGLVIAIEPMINVGTKDVRVLDNGWTVVTADGKASAHFEHTVAVTQEGPRMLTWRRGEEEENF